MKYRKVEVPYVTTYHLAEDSDMLVFITGGIAEAFYGEVPEDILRKTKELLTPDLLAVVEWFRAKYNKQR